jgi:hypothetical protein
LVSGDVGVVGVDWCWIASSWDGPVKIALRRNVQLLYSQGIEGQSDAFLENVVTALLKMDRVTRRVRCLEVKQYLWGLVD